MATYNTQWEHTLLNEMNRVRTQPRALASELEGLRANYDGVMYQLPGNKVVRTSEGVAGLNSAIQFLQSATPVEAFQGMAEGLSKAAFDLCEDNGPKGLVGNRFSDGTSAQHRWVRYGQWKGKIGENICYAFDDPRQIVYQWIIDDGNSNRPNRASLMNGAFKVVGIAKGPHSTYNHMVVVTFAASFADGGPGEAPKVGRTNRDGGHTVQSADRRTEEQTIGATDGVFIITTDDLHARALSELQLTAKGKVLTLSRTFKSGGKTKRKNLQWQLPFNFAAYTVCAAYQQGEVTISLPRPYSDGSNNILLGALSMLAGSNEERVKLDVKKSGNQFVITVCQSKYDETITLLYQNDVLLINSARTADPQGEGQLSQPLRLPFTITPDLVTSRLENGKVVIWVSKPGTEEPATIPIREGTIDQVSRDFNSNQNSGGISLSKGINLNKGISLAKS